MEYRLLPVVALLVGFIFTRWACKPFLALLSGAGLVRPNYKAQEIPVGAGAVFFFALIITTIITFAAVPGYLNKDKILSFLFLAAITTLAGIMDDAFGSRQVSGLKGHLGRLFKGELTTGALKALAISSGSLIIFLPAEAPWEALFNAALVALFVNSINLFDLRPGRAGKVFLIAAFAIIIVSWKEHELLPLWVMVGALLAFLPVDLRARAMMGDAGANTLGASLGIAVAWTMDIGVRVAVFLGLLILHLLAERYSFTKIIARNRVLNFLDLLGRRE